MHVRYLDYWQPKKGKFREFPTLYKDIIPHSVIEHYVGVSLYYDIQMCSIVEAVITEQFEFD